MFRISALIATLLLSSTVYGEDVKVDWTKLQDRSLETLVGLIQLDTSQPAGNEHLAAGYIADRLESADIPYKLFEPVEG